MRIAVIGGGAAGIMAAYASATRGADVVLYERNEKLGKKIYLTGKGRCNLTNASDTRNHMDNLMRNPRFMYSAYRALSPYDLMDLVEKQGIPLKTERGNRVFPESDKSSDILFAFKKILQKAGVEVRLNEKVISIEKTIEEFLVSGETDTESYDRVILATGGISYQATGSTGDGYRFAEKFGHDVTELRPGLIGIKADLPSELAGLSLKNIALNVLYKGKEIASEFGEMLFTHSGISGPVVLTLSSKINRLDFKDILLMLDLKPALSPETLDSRLLREFSVAQNRSIKNVLPTLMPKSLISHVLHIADVREDIPCHNITKAQRSSLITAMKFLPIKPLDFEDYNSAIITSGGIDVKEIDPKNMQSKIVKGLYFAGEMLDVDALTGGYNLQVAFSTGYLAGVSAANAC